jgi:mitogen-activated protein kinase kinase kinase
MLASYPYKPKLGQVPITFFEANTLLGAFGMVWKAVLNHTTTKQEVVAVKELKAADPEYQVELFEDFQREVFIMSCLHHPNIVQLYGVTLKPLQMILEYVSAGDLVSYCLNSV